MIQQIVNLLRPRLRPVKSKHQPEIFLFPLLPADPKGGRRRGPESERRLLWLSVLTLLATSIPLRSQVGISSLAAGSVTGIQPYGSYEGQNESINLANGNLTVAVPLLHLKRRAGLDLDLRLLFVTASPHLESNYSAVANSIGWQLSPQAQPFGNSMVNIPRLYYQYGVFDGLAQEGSGSCQGQCGPPVEVRCTKNFILLDPSGAQHVFSNISDCSPTGVSG